MLRKLRSREDRGPEQTPGLGLLVSRQAGRLSGSPTLSRPGTEHLHFGRPLCPSPLEGRQHSQPSDLRFA